MNRLNLTNYTICGICSNCGECCTDALHLSDEEIKKIDDYIKENKVFQNNLHKDKDIFDMTCPFRDNVLKRCQIYPVRPEICRIFKCDRQPKDAIKIRNFTNYNKKIRSMSLVFFNDKSIKQKYEKRLGVKVYGREKK